jgi:hypothetical protein
VSAAAAERRLVPAADNVRLRRRAEARQRRGHQPARGLLSRIGRFILRLTGR